MPMSTTAFQYPGKVHGPIENDAGLTIGATTTGTTQSAHVSIAVFRAALGVQPRRRSQELCQPPTIEPTSAIKNTVIMGGPTVLMLTSNMSFMNLPNQNT